MKELFAATFFFAVLALTQTEASGVGGAVCWAFAFLACLGFFCELKR